MDGDQTPSSAPSGLAAFFAVARSYRADPRFEEDEIEYKLRLAHDLSRARTAIRAGDSAWYEDLTRALKSRDNNVIDWRQRDKFLGAGSSNSEGLAKALRRLWFGEEPAGDGFTAFASYLAKIGFHQPGAQLTIASTLLMAIDGTAHPPIRTTKFETAFILAGYPPFGNQNGAGQRYRSALRFLDEVCAAASAYGVPIRHRLDAQGVVWCAGGGWKRGPDPPANPLDVSDVGAVLGVAVSPSTETERQALVQARVGQGRFRDGLIQVWGGCAITGCRNLRVLRASHLKPWRICSDADRLNPYNGLLLTPNLDAALDRGLISFTDDGTVLASKSLSRADRNALAINTGNRLRQLDKRHHEFLRYHRESVFQPTAGW